LSDLSYRTNPMEVEVDFVLQMDAIIINSLEMIGHFRDSEKQRVEE